MMDKSLFSLPGIMPVMGMLVVFALVLSASIIGEAVSLSAAITTMWQGGSLAHALAHIALFFGCFALQALVHHLQDGMLDRFANKQVEYLRGELLAGLFRTRGQMVRDNGTAAVTSSVLEGASQTENYLRIILPKLVGVVVIPFVLLVCSFVLDLTSGVILLVMYPVIIFYMVMLGKVAKARAENQYAKYTRMSNHFVDTLRGMDTLRAFGRGRQNGEQIYQTSEDFRVATIDTLKVATLSSAVLDLIATLGVAGVAIMLAFHLVDGSIGLFAALAVLVLSPEYFKPIRQFGSDYHASLDGKNALTAIVGMIDAAKETAPAREHAVAPWSPYSMLELDEVSYTYPGADTPALKDVYLSIEGCQKVGVVGASGSGKSTLASLLAGFASPDGGTITIDGATFDADEGGLGFSDWQNQVAYIPQDPYVFGVSLRDNIRFYAPESTDEQVMRAVELVGLDELLAQLPEGLDTVIGEGGRALSGGQAQRIALARVLLDDSRRILIFDEPTAHLDIETELELKSRMLPLMEGRLVIFATHRLHWLADMDWIVDMEDGEVVEQGEYRELLAERGALWRLVENMNGGAR
ncbi:thiol reductant ABC exporter subunit CydD [Slackia heliotrinireducens]|uniref:thiol reductant ABC exporter subunit CydD n=1 Tax=Slackia heliotrinireducens TaxID=84110 RepID=UPI003314E1CC